MTPPRAQYTQRVEDFVRSVAGLGSDMERPHLLRHVVEAAVEVIGAGGGAIGLLSESGTDVSELVSVGLQRDEFDVIAGQPERHGMVGPRSFLGAEIRGRDRVLGSLYLTDRRQAGEFSAEDAGLAAGFAGVAAIAIDNAALRVRLGELALVEDRERIAVDLHDTVTQRLFAISLTLQGTVKAISPPAAAQRVVQAVDDLGQTIRQVRSTIFASYPPLLASGDHNL